MLEDKQIEKILQDLLAAVILKGEDPEKVVIQKKEEIQILVQNYAIKSE